MQIWDSSTSLCMGYMLYYSGDRRLIWPLVGIKIFFLFLKWILDMIKTEEKKFVMNSFILIRVQR